MGQLLFMYSRFGIKVRPRNPVKSDVYRDSGSSCRYLLRPIVRQSGTLSLIIDRL